MPLKRRRAVGKALKPHKKGKKAPKSQEMVPLRHPVYYNIPGFKQNQVLKLEHLPNEIMIPLFNMCDIVSATCLGLASRRFYNVFSSEYCYESSIPLSLQLRVHHRDGHGPVGMKGMIESWMPKDLKIYDLYAKKFTSEWGWIDRMAKVERRTDRFYARQRLEKEREERALARLQWAYEGDEEPDEESDEYERISDDTASDNDPYE